MIFTDVRGSTRLSEELELREYVRLINQFYATTTGVFVETDGFMMDVLGDEVFALYPTGFSGVTEGSETVVQRQLTAARKAFEAVSRLVKLSEASPPLGMSFGISLHNAEVYVGTVRGAEEGISDVRVWGPEVNKAARMCAAAKAGEVLISPDAINAAGLDASQFESRELPLKGLTAPVSVYCLRA
jgi:adenylate cyclase